MADYTRSATDTLTAVETTRVPNFLYAYDSATLTDGPYAERITFLRAAVEAATLVEVTQKRATRVGNSDVGWSLVPVGYLSSQRLEAGEVLTVTVEDLLNHRALCQGRIRILNIEGRQLTIRVTESVQVDGVVTEFVLFDSVVPAQSAPTDIPLAQTSLLPDRLVWHDVTVTNLETTHTAYVGVLVSGMAGQVDRLPVTLPTPPAGRII